MKKEREKSDKRRGTGVKWQKEGEERIGNKEREKMGEKNGLTRNVKEK